MMMNPPLFYNPVDPSQSDPYLSKTQSFLSIPPVQRPILSPVPISAPQSAMPPAPFLSMRAEPSRSLDWGRSSLSAPYSHDSSIPQLDDPMLHKVPSQETVLFNPPPAKNGALPSPAVVSERNSVDTRKSLSTPPLMDRTPLPIA